MSAEPANDNVDGTITPDDILMLTVLFVIFAGSLGLLAYVMLGGTLGRDAVRVAPAACMAAPVRLERYGPGSTSFVARRITSLGTRQGGGGEDSIYVERRHKRGDHIRHPATN